MINSNIELRKCIDYANRSDAEQGFEEWLVKSKSPIALIFVEGFEERSLGIAEKLVQSGMKVSGVVLGRYINKLELNKKYRARFEKLADTASHGNWQVVENRNDGLWVEEALGWLDGSNVLLDITGMSNRGLFGALDAAAAACRSGRNVYVSYSEPKVYWPKFEHWESIKQDLSGKTGTTISELVDKAPWLFGYEHRVELVSGHEGYDSPGNGRALIGFLPFKPARLAAILSQENYSEIVFVAGRPRLPENAWRLSALREMNSSLISDWNIVEMSTFSYRSAVKEITELLFVKPSLLEAYNVHMAVLGSKLQTIACWAVSSLVSSVTMVTSIPATYFPESFSDGIGVSWIFKLLSPNA